MCFFCFIFFYPIYKLKEAGHVFSTHGDIELVGAEAWEPNHTLA
jgi:hypothetical protein